MCQGVERYYPSERHGAAGFWDAAGWLLRESRDLTFALDMSS